MIGIVDYGAGNVASVMYALEAIGVQCFLSKDPMELLHADKIIFPGVGEASSAMKRLRSTGIDVLLKNFKGPLLGICLGMQLLTEYSEEGSTECLALMPGTCCSFNRQLTRTPHIGWAQVQYQLSNPLFAGIKQQEFFYFAHSFYLPVQQQTEAVACNGIEFTAAVRRNLVFGLQFHPEKSGNTGLQILKNFTNLSKEIVEGVL